MDSITDLLNLEDPDVFISETIIEGSTKILVLESRLRNHYCPECGFRMHSKGIHKRYVNHPILQDTYELKLLIRQRRWRCTNPSCGHEANDSFNFVKKYRRNTNATDMLILDSFKDLTLTATDIASRFHVSDSQAIRTFDKYVKMNRLHLTDAICVDEVYIDMDSYCKYALVIQDFHTGDPIDFLISRRTNVTEPYFAAIPKEERFAVKYLISDMYNPYIQYVEKYFPNAVSVVDSFHVTQWIIRELDKFLRRLLKDFKRKDEERAENLSAERGYPVTVPPSREVHMLQKYRWLILMNQSGITYHPEDHYDYYFKRFMNTYDYERMLLDIHPSLRQMRDLKEMYVTFNDRNAGNPERAAKELDDLIEFYLHCDVGMFVDFAMLLSKYKENIINSFVMMERIGPRGQFMSRLSNGPMESFNRKIKDIKRISRGFRNFNHLRNRILYSTRSNLVIDGTGTPETDYYYVDEE